jgi:DtxR family transcriptional regulator, Mn-dependent transcriptional regulator
MLRIDMKNRKSDQITPSKEDYLKVLLQLTNMMQDVRSIDVARAMDFSRATISRTMKELDAAGYILKSKDGNIRLTEKGLLVAQKLKYRNDLLKRFLINVLLVDQSIAEIDACQIEHAMSSETIDKLERYLLGQTVYSFTNLQAKSLV